ncbi:glutamate-5-semialdehyde dehydrogenase [Clostridium sp.]|uniref:glutamate-5-semialdehyde dehydrogenase n=1 Tax=Clostridium sp. TaxID=1506 RepID=UPI0032163650
MNIECHVIEKGKLAKEASRTMSTISTNIKNKALLSMAEALITRQSEIFTANALDMQNGKAKKLSESLLDRLLLNEDRVNSMAQGLREVASLDDPIGEVVRMFTRPNCLQIGEVRVPLGVIGIIYEARPNVTVDAAAICIKAGSSVILKGGKEAFNSNMKIGEIISTAAEEAGLPKGCINLIETTEREAVHKMMTLNQYIDVLIPRGGAGLIQSVVNNSTVPVIETGVGNCHVFVDESADINNAIDIVINGKTQRPAVCNALETLLVHKTIAQNFLPSLSQRLLNYNVEIRGCEKTLKILPDATPAIESDWENEFLDLILAVKIVDSIEDAMDHIYKYGTKHSEAILTKDYINSQKFLKEVDAAAVYVNASTRFTDGSEFGFGAEIGISTQKLHARGPMGIKQLTSSKYIIYGTGQIR